MKIMVCLISVQHVPNLRSIKSVRPDQLILAVTSGMEGKDTQLLKALEANGLDYKEKIKIIDLGKGEEQSAEPIYKKLHELFIECPTDEWIVNLTGGTKPMSIGAYEFSKDKGLKTLYIAEGNQQQAVDLLDGSCTPLKYNVTSSEFLAGYGFDILNGSSLARTEDRALLWTKLAAHLALHNEDADLREMLGKLQYLKEAQIILDKNKWEKNGLVISEKDDLFLANGTLRYQIASQFGMSTIGARFTGRLDKSAVEFLTGKWLEVFVWSLLLPFEDRGIIWDLHLGVLAGKSGPGKNNDLDVSFMVNQSLCIVECKTGERKLDSEADNVLYKIEAIKSGPKAIRVKTYLATTWPEVVDQDTGEIKKSLKNRCELYGCQIIHGAELSGMADLYLRRSTDPIEKVAEAFSLKMGVSN